MAHHKSAQKRARQNIKRNTRNSARMSAVRTTIKKLRAAVEEEEKPEVLKGLFVACQSVIANAATRGLLHPNNAARKIGRLAKAVATVKHDEATEAKTASKSKAKKKTATKKKTAKKAAKKKAASKKKSTSKKKKTSKKK